MLRIDDVDDDTEDADDSDDSAAEDLPSPVTTAHPNFDVERGSLPHFSVGLHWLLRRLGRQHRFSLSIHTVIDNIISQLRRSCKLSLNSRCKICMKQVGPKMENGGFGLLLKHT